MREFLQDLQYGIRVFARNPTFTLVALLALALGIGATTAIFSVVDTVLLKPLPYPEAGRIVSIGLTGLGEDSLALGPDYVDWRARNHVFEQIECPVTFRLPVGGVITFALIHERDGQVD